MIPKCDTPCVGPVLVRPIWLAKRINPNPNLPLESSPTVTNTNDHSLLLPSPCCCRRRCFLALVVFAVTLKCRRRPPPRCRRRRWRLLLRRRQVGAHPSCCERARSHGARSLSALPRRGGASAFRPRTGTAALGAMTPHPPLDAGLRPGGPLPRVCRVGRTF